MRFALQRMRGQDRLISSMRRDSRVDNRAVAEIEAQPAPFHLPADVDVKIRARLPIDLKI